MQQPQAAARVCNCCVRARGVKRRCDVGVRARCVFFYLCVGLHAPGVDCGAAERYQAHFVGAPAQVAHVLRVASERGDERVRVCEVHVDTRLARAREEAAAGAVRDDCKAILRLLQPLACDKLVGDHIRVRAVAERDDHLCAPGVHSKGGKRVCGLERGDAGHALVVPDADGVVLGCGGYEGPPHRRANTEHCALVKSCTEDSAIMREQGHLNIRRALTEPDVHYSISAL